MKKGFWSLKKKLAIFSLLLLSIPFLGVGFLKQLEEILVENLLSNLKEYAQSLAFSLQNQSEYFSVTKHTTSTQSIYVPTMETPPIVDGYLDEWLNVSSFAKTIARQERQLSINLARHHYHLMVGIQASDFSPAYRTVSDTFSVSDQILIALTTDDNKTIELQFLPAAVGKVNPFIKEHSLKNFWVSNAYWQETEHGYSLELQLPMQHNWRAITVKQIDYQPQSNTTEIVETGTDNPWTLVWPSPDIERQLQVLPVGEGKRIWVLDAQGSVLARRGSLDRALNLQPVNPLIHFLFSPPKSDVADPRQRAIQLDMPLVKQALGGELSESLESSPNTNSAIAMTAAPIYSSGKVIGVLLVEETVAAIQMIQQRAMNVFVNTSLVILLVLIVSLIVIASRVTRRITRLRGQTQEAVDGFGKVTRVIKPENIGDELGDLSRSFSQMSLRLREYNDYMEKLADRLTHELRTPIAMIRTSIDNIALSNDESITQSVEHAKTSVERMSGLITRMREAARLEQSILSLPKETFYLDEFVLEYTDAIKDVYLPHPIETHIQGRGIEVRSSKELLAQCFDKLLSNAKDFAKPNSVLGIHVQPYADRVDIAVSNEGPRLPNGSEDSIFSSMLSVRSSEYKSDEQSHLGLGLYIVRLIAEYHHGNTFARNTDEPKGVIIGMSIPIKRLP